MYGFESWTVKKAESRRIDAFEVRCWRRLLRVPWTARRSNQSILKEISPIHWKDWCWSWSSSTLATSCEELRCWEPAQEIPLMTRSYRTRGTPWAIPSMTRSCGRDLISKASGLDGPPGLYWGWTSALTHWKILWCWEGLGAGGEGGDRGWDGWMASLTQWTWVWVNSGSWWWTGRPGVLWFMGSQRVGHDWATELNWLAFSSTQKTPRDTCWSSKSEFV